MEVSALCQDIWRRYRLFEFDAVEIVPADLYLLAGAEDYEDPVPKKASDKYSVILVSDSSILTVPTVSNRIRSVKDSTTPHVKKKDLKE